MKIIYVTTGLGIGGAENVVCNLADNMYSKRHNVLIISLTGEVKVKPQKNIEIISLNLNKNILQNIKKYFHLRKIITRFKPDIVHSHMIHANIFSRLIRLTTNIPVLISTAHSKNEGGRLRMMLYKITDAIPDISTNVSQEAVDEFINIGATHPGRMIVVHNGVDCERFSFSVVNRITRRRELGITENTKLLLSVGRLTEAKDYPNLFNAIAKIGSVFDFKLAIIGTGEKESELKALVKQLNIDDKILWLGARQDIDEWLSAADLFVLSSAWEGFPLVILEAMSCARLIVSTDAGGIAEAMGSKDFLVPVSHAEELSRKIIDILNATEEQQRAICEGNRKRILELYSLEQCGEKWVELYSYFLNR